MGHLSNSLLGGFGQAQSGRWDDPWFTQSAEHVRAIRMEQEIQMQSHIRRRAMVNPEDIFPGGSVVPAPVKTGLDFLRDEVNKWCGNALKV